MKKIIAIMAISVSFIGCEKDNTATNPESTIAKGDIKVINIGTSNPDSRIIQGGTMLAFDSWEQFAAKAKELDDQVEAYEDAFVTQYDDLSLDALDAKEEEIGFDSQKPLIDFENAIGFTNALRKTVNIEDVAYLVNLDPALDPEMKYAFSDSELSLVNERQQVMIGTELFQFTNDGYVIIARNYAANLLALATNTLGVKLPDVTVVNDIAGGTCKAIKRSQIQPGYDNNNRQIRLIASIRSVPFYTRTNSKSVAFKKKRRGGYKRARIYMSVKTIADLNNKNCDNQVGGHKASTGENAYKKRRQRHNSTNTSSGPYYAKSLVSVNGGFRFDDNYATYALQF